MEEQKITFDQIPQIMAQLVQEVHGLSEKVNVLSVKQDKQNEISSQRITHKAITSQQVCEIIHKKPVTLYRMVARSQIPCYKSGKTLVFFEDEIYDWLKLRKKGEARVAMDLAREYCTMNPL